MGRPKNSKNMDHGIEPLQIGAILSPMQRCKACKGFFFPDPEVEDQTTCEKCNQGKSTIIFDLVDIERIKGLASKGLSVKQIALSMQTHPEVFLEAIKRYPVISEAITDGQEMGVACVTNALYNAAVYEGDVGAMKYFLEHMAPEQWGPKNIGGNTVNINLANVTDDEKLKIAQAYSERRGIAKININDHPNITDVAILAKNDD